MRELQSIIPVDVQVKLREFSEQGLNGQLVLNFNQGRIESFESREHHRVPSKNGLGSVAPRLAISPVK